MSRDLFRFLGRRSSRDWSLFGVVQADGARARPPAAAGLSAHTLMASGSPEGRAWQI